MSSPLSTTCPNCKTAQGELRCKDCFGGALLCKDCCLFLHQRLPCHRLERWSGGFFIDTSLHKEGFMLHLGHNGDRCPMDCLPDMDSEIWAEENVWEDVDETRQNLLDKWESLDTNVVIVVDCSGIHQRRIRYCNCSSTADRHIQLLRAKLFPASFKNPSTVFTFEVLEYFHLDAVECKTSAMSFFAKLRRITNYNIPGSVPVSHFSTFLI